MNLLRKVWTLYSRNEKALLTISLIVRVLLVFADLAGIALLGMSVSVASGATIDMRSVTGSVVTLLTQFSPANPYIAIAIVAVAFFIIKGTLSLTVTRELARYSARLETRKTSRIYGALLSGGLEKLERWSLPWILHALTNSAEMAFSRSVVAGSIIFGELVLVLGISSVLLFVSPTLYLIMVIYFGIIFAVMHFSSGHLVARLTSKLDKGNIGTQAVVMDSLNSLRQISASGNQRYFYKQFETFRGLSAKSSGDLATLTGVSRYIVELAVVLGVGLLIIERLNPAFAVPPSTAAIFIAGGFRISASLLPIQGSIQVLRQATESAKAALELAQNFDLFNNAKTPNLNNDAVLIGAQPTIYIQNLRYTYANNNIELFGGVTLKIPFGSYVAISGPSGAGKSTFADLLLGLRKPTSGQIKFDSVSATEILASRRGIVGYVPQLTPLIEGSLRENLALKPGDSPADDEAIWEALESAQIGDFVRQLPQGLDTQVGKSVSTFSGGQVQRIGIARALVSHPKVLILDEATSALDAPLEDQITTVLNRLRKKMTVIVIAHRPKTLQAADLILEINSSTITGKNINASSQTNDVTNDGAITPGSWGAA
jgi:ABC-type multidrug transport system fused ATPase/permease subunit